MPKDTLLPSRPQAASAAADIADPSTALASVLNSVRPSRAVWVEKRFLLVALTVGVLSSGSIAAACDSSSCSLLTRGEQRPHPKKTLRLELSFG